MPSQRDSIPSERSDQLILNPAVLVGPCPLGKGLFATTDFKPGETILRFRGVLIDFAAMLRKGVNQANPLQIGANLYIDLEAPGVYANHSCDPNAGIRNDTDLVAIQAIRRGEEIRYDYSTTMWEDHWTLVCHCGSNQCRGLVADFPTLPEIQQQRYLSSGIVQAFIVARMHRQSTSVPGSA